MATRTAPRSSTPVAVLLAGFVVLGAMGSSLAYRVYATWPDRTPAAPVGAKEAPLPSSPAVTGDRMQRPARRTTAPPAQWSSHAHGAALLPDSPRPHDATEALAPAPALSVAPVEARPRETVTSRDGWASRGHPLGALRPPRQEMPGALSRPTSFPAALPPTKPRSVTRGDLSRRQVLLSFDGGSQAGAAASILQTLQREGVRTTLFLTGQFIRNHPEFVHQAVRAGHEIGNHTMHHRHLTTWESNRRHDTLPDLSREVLLQELDGARQALLEVAGVDMAPYWRAPYGEVNREILRWAAEAGYVHVGWSRGLDSLDWVSDPRSPRYRTPQEFLTVLHGMAGRRQGLNGGIVLMHLHSDRPAAQRFDGHLEEIIRWLRASGYDLVPASTLAGASVQPGSTPARGGP